MRCCMQAPTAIAVFPKEIWTYPKSWCAKQYNLKRWTVMPAGGESASDPVLATCRPHVCWQNGKDNIKARVGYHMCAGDTL